MKNEGIDRSAIGNKQSWGTIFVLFLIPVGAGISAVAIAADFLGIGDPAGFGLRQIMLTLVGFIVLLGGVGLATPIGQRLMHKWHVVPSTVSERHRSWQRFAFSRYTGYGLATLFLAAIGFLWWHLAAAWHTGDRSLGLYSDRGFVLRVVASYLLIWGIFFILSRQTVVNTGVNFGLSTATFILLFCLLELPALLGLVDYRLIFAPFDQHILTRFGPWKNPINIWDEELGYIRRPGYKLTGRNPGDLVSLFGISTDRTYQVNAQYDNQGFRNDHEIEQAPVVVIGDSFLEWPLLSQEELVSSRLAELLQVEVANFGQTAYGPQQELIILKRYGLKTHPQLILWFFFEGNDLSDAYWYKRLIKDENIRRRDDFTHRAFTINVLPILKSLTIPKPQRDSSEIEKQSCWLLGNRSEDEDKLYFGYGGPHKGEATNTEDLLDMAQQVILAAQNLSADNGAQLVLIYIPTKFRVYRDFCYFSEDSYVQHWRLDNLPSRMEDWAKVHSILYLDLTPSLRDAAAKGELVYFPDDTHWNAKGSEVAANTISSFLDNIRWFDKQHDIHKTNTDR